MRPSLVLVTMCLFVSGCTSGSARPQPTSAPTHGFHIEYDVTDDGGVGSLEVTDVARPYRARTLRYSLDGTGRVSQGGAAWSASGVYSIRPDGSVAEVSIAWPGPPGPDAHLDLALPVALRQHLVKREGTGSVLGIDCVEWVSKQPLDGAPFAPATAARHTTSCVSASGVVLRDEWVQDGKTLRTRVATVLRSTPDLSGDRLLGAIATPAPAELSPFTITRSTQAELTRLIPFPDPASPPGLHSDEAVAVLDVDRSGSSERVTREGAVLTWVGEGHLVEAKFGRDLLSETPAPTEGEPVALGRLGSGRLTPLLTGLQVEVLGPGGLLLTVKSDLPEPALLIWLRGLSF